ncbi:MAG: bifunctional metallophosphatase/5'-nucleotidase [Oscillospiraceae bacterium]|nr:bifunctional metallophosphatase/5'-nucleotidase [Oscillospiraceae bacterium]
MNRIRRRILPLFLLGLLLFSISLTALAAPGDGDVTATILFTHDMHSHLLPASAEDGGSYGGFARLNTILKEQRTAAAKEGTACLTVDAGDFSMGSLFQTIYTTQASELRCLGAMGFDVVTFGNHEFEYRGNGLADMLRAALASGDPLPAIVQANYTTPAEPNQSQAVTAAIEDYGVSEYVMLEKDGVRFAVFGLMGQDAHDCAPLSGMEFEPIADAAKRVVAEIQAKEDYDFLVCLSHSGTSEESRQSEDELLAAQVDGIDFIVSGHTHTTLSEPKIVNNTVIASVGEYGANLGKITLSKSADGALTIRDYTLLPIDGTITEDPELAAVVQGFQDLVEQEYLSSFHMTFDQVLAHTAFPFTPLSQFAAEQEEDSLGNLITDAYRYAVEQVEGGSGAPIAAAFVNSGVIRASFPAGDITVSNAFDVSSIGSGADGSPGYPLIEVYLTGKELKTVFEVDPSIGPIFPGAQLYASGVTYRFNMNRLLFNRTTDGALLLSDGSQAPIENNTLYRVITNLYSSQMLGLVTGKSYGILRITPKDAWGNPITNYEDHIIHLPDGGELKEWYALATYLASFPTEDGVPQVPRRYQGPEGRKVEVKSLNLIELLRQPRWTTVLVVVLILAVVILVAVLFWRSSSWRRRRIYGKQSRGRNFYRRYRG